MPEWSEASRPTPAALFRLALRLMWRDWRGGELRLLLLALIMAVTSVTGIALFTDRLQQALLLESANMLAADRVLSGREPAPMDWIQEARDRGLRTGETVSFSSMAFSDTDNVLVAAKAVSDSYPLRGNLLVADQPFSAGYPIEGGPSRGEVWVESRVVPALGLDVGGTVYVGEAEFVVSRVIVQEPDRQQGGMIDNAGPRLMLNVGDLPATNVIQTGSRVSYRYLFAGDQRDLDSFGEWLDTRTSGQYRLRDVRDESQEIADALGRGESFLLLGSLFAVLLAGVAIALTARRYSERHFDYAAILKTLGCTSHQITVIYFTILMLLLLLGIIIGSVLGWLVHQAILQILGAVIPIDLPPFGPTPFFIGALTAFVCLLSFALPPLLALRNTSPLRVLRKDLDDNRLGARLPYVFGFSGAVLLVFWYSADLMLTGILVAAVVGVAMAISLLGYILLGSTAAVGTHAGNALRLALSAARRRRQQSVLQIMVFSLTIMSLLILVLLRTDLIDDWQAQLPDDTPNHFLMNVNSSQVEGISRFLADNGIEPMPFYPMISAGLLTINGQTAREVWGAPGEQRSITERGSGEDNEADNGDIADEEESPRMANRQVTWTDRLPADNEVVAGRWWHEDQQAGYVSVERDYAERLGIRLGDDLVFQAGGQRFEAQVQSLRSVRWDNMQPNFFFIFSPGTLDAFGATWLSTALMDGEQKRVLNDLLRAYPTIVVLEVDALIEQIQNIIAQVTAAVELIAFLVLLAGALVLLACVNATLDERFRENAVLRALGAPRSLIMNSLMAEFAFIGLLAGIIATLGAEFSMYYLQTRVFGQSFVAHYWAWLAGPVAGTLVIGALGVMATRRVVRTSPLTVLREVA